MANTNNTDPLKGIRLTDLYGYNSGDFATYYNNIKSTQEENAELPADFDIKVQNKYLNNLIRTQRGDDYYNKNFKGLGLNEKIAKYNELFSGEQTGPTPTTDISQEIDSTVTNNAPVENASTEDALLNNDLAAKYFNGDLRPSLTPNMGSQYSAGYRDWFAMQANKPVDYDDKTEDNIDRQIQIFSKLYDKDYQQVDEGNEKSEFAVNKSLDYKNKVLDIIDNDPKLANSLYVEFENSVLHKIDDWNNYQNTDLLPYTPNQMKDIMAEFYARNAVQGGSAATDWLYGKIHNEINSNQGFGRRVAATIVGLGANLSGTAVATLGLSLNLIPTLVRNIAGSDGYINIDGVSGLTNFIYNLSNNPVTRYGNDIIETGAWLPSLQEQNKKTHFNPNTIFREVGEENNFLNPNTIFDIIQQGGFTVGAMYSAGAVAKILQATVGKGTSAIAQRVLLQNASKVASVAANSIEDLGKLSITTVGGFLPAISEASIAGFDQMDRVSKDMNEYLTNLAYSTSGGKFDSAIDDYIKQHMDDEDGWNAFYDKHKDNTLPLFTGDNARRNEDDYAQFRAFEKEKLYEQYRREVANKLVNNPEIQDMLNGVALRTGARLLTDQAMVIFLIDAFFSNILGTAYKATKKATMRSLFNTATVGGVKIIRNSAGKLVAKSANNKYIRYPLAAVRSLSEPVGEGGQELYQNLDQNVNETLGDNYAAQYILNMSDPEAIEKLNDGIGANFELVQKIMKENFASQENIYAFLLGAASSGIGNTQILHGIANSIQQRRAGMERTDKSFKGVLKDIVTNYWRNPFIEGINDEKKRMARSAAEAEDINKWLADHEEVAKMNDMEQMIAWFIKANNAALNSDSDVDYRDALMGQRLAGVIMFDRLGGRLSGKTIKAQLHQMSLVTDVNSKEAQAMIAQAKQIAGKSEYEGMSDEDILKRITKNAKETYEAFGRLKSIRRYLNSEFGDILSENSKDAWAFEAMMQDDLTERQRKIIDNARQAYNASGVQYQSATTSSELERATATYGNLESARTILNEQLKQLAALKAQKKSMPYFRFVTIKNNIKDQIEKTRNAIKLFNSATELPVITADRILGLDATSIASLLDSNNSKYFSEEQNAEIAKFKNTKGITKSILKDLNDAAQIKQRQETFERTLKEVTSSNKNILYYDRSIRTEAARNLVKHRLDRALRATDYAAFEDEVDKYMDEKHSIYEDMVLDDVLHNSPYYARWIKTNAERRAAKSILEVSNSYKALSRDDRRLFDLAYERALRDNDTSFDHVISLLNNDDFRRTASEKYGIPIDQQFDESNIVDILNQIDNYNENARDVKQHEEKLKKASTAAQQKSPEKYTLSTVLNGKIYLANIDKYHEIFDKMADLLMCKRSVKNNKFSLAELIDIAKLYDENITQDVIFSDEKFKDTYFGHISLNAAIKLMIEQYEGEAQKELTDEGKIRLANSYRLINTLNHIVGLAKGSDVRLADTIRKDIISIDPSYGKKFETPKIEKEKKKVKPNIFNGLGDHRAKLRIKPYNYLTEEERAYAEANHFVDNNEWFQNAAIEGKIGPDIKLIFIEDKALLSAYRNNKDYSQEAESDFKPIVIAVEVPEGTANAIRINDKYYLKINFLDNSRSNTAEELNSYNALRENTHITDDGVIQIDDNGKYTIYEYEAEISVKKTTQQPEVTGDSVVSFVKNITGDDIDAFAKTAAEANGKTISQEFTKLPESEKIKYLLRNKIGVEFVSVKTAYDKKTKTLIRKFTDSKGENHTQRVAVEQDLIDTYESDGLSASAMNRIGILNQQDGTVSMMLIKQIDEITFRVNGEDKSVNDILSDEANNYITYIESNEHKADASPLSNVMIAMRDAIKNAINKNSTGNIFEANNKKLYKTISAVLYGIKNTVSATIKDGEIVITGYCDQETLSESIEDLKNPERLNNFVRLFFKSLIFESNGDVRMDETSGYPTIKMQVNFRNLAPTDNNKIKTKYYNETISSIVDFNLIKFERDNIVKEDASIVNNNAPTNDNTTDTTSVNSAIKALYEADDSVARGESSDSGIRYIGVTTFIHSGKPIDDTPSTRVALWLGTISDRIFRQYINFLSTEYKDETVFDDKFFDQLTTKIIDWNRDVTRVLNSNGELVNGWSNIPGYQRDAIRNLIEQFHNNVIGTIAARGEQIVNKELYFRAKLYNEDGSKFIPASMEPDMVTVDKNGHYHIYDFKTFKQSASINSTTYDFRQPNGSTTQLRLNGVSEDTIKSWTDQLSVYKKIIEAKTGGIVDTIEIIPVQLNYNIGNGIIEKTIESNYATMAAYFPRSKNPNEGVLKQYKDKDGQYKDIAVNSDKTKTVVYQPMLLRPKENLESISSYGWQSSMVDLLRNPNTGESEATQSTLNTASEKQVAEPIASIEGSNNSGQTKNDNPLNPTVSPTLNAASEKQKDETQCTLGSKSVSRRRRKY